MASTKAGCSAWSPRPGIPEFCRLGSSFCSDRWYLPMRSEKSAKAAQNTYATSRLLKFEKHFNTWRLRDGAGTHDALNQSEISGVAARGFRTKTDDRRRP